MFSPEATSQGTLSLRNPRRRPRNSSEDHLASRQAAKRRKRSSLTPSTFEPPPKAKANGHLPVLNGHHPAKEQSPELPANRDNASEKASLAIRRHPSRSEREKKTSRPSEGIVLTKNNHYVVTKESAIPDELQDIVRGKEPWQAHFNEDLGYATIFTYSKAVIWRHTQMSSSSDASRVLTINIPHETIKSKNSLPLGTLVHDSGAGETALLVIQQNGKVSYWESIASAAHADTMRQRQQGVHGSLSGLFSGEVVNDVCNAELDGFILTTNAGRIIHLSVRDSEGKLSISTHLLRGSNAAANGLFGGLRSVFSSSGWRKDIAAARCAPTKSRNFRKCIVATKQCVFQTWNLARHSTKALEAEIDAKQAMLDAILPFAYNGHHHELQVLDFSLFPASGNERRDSQHILVLAGLKFASATQYFLLDILVDGGSLDVHFVQPISCWDQAFEEDKPWLGARSRILMSHHARTALIVFDTFYIIISLARTEEGPSSQLQRESDSTPEPFQDILFFSGDRDFHVVGCASKSGASATDDTSFYIFVNNFGLVQTAVARVCEEEPPSVRRATLCQSKMEQAVFFGDLPTKFFDFRRSSRIFDWSVEEIEQAALRVNESVLDSTSPYISTISPSMEHQLKERSTALKELIKYVGRWNLTDLTRWQLLWSAEKMAAARAIWQTFSTHLARREQQSIQHNGENIVLLKEAIDMLSEKYKHEAEPERGERDIIRHYLIKDIANIELVVAWAAQALVELYREGLQDPVKQALLVDQADDVQICALETAFKFREQNAELYGVPQRLIQDGIYTGSYRDFPDVWTSCTENVLKVKHLAILSRECAVENGESTDETMNMLDFAVLTKIAQDAARLASLACKVCDERYRTLRDRPGDSNQAIASTFEKEYLETRRDLIPKLVDVELPDEGIKIAERYDDVPALADVVALSLSVMNDRLDDDTTPSDEIEELKSKLSQYQNRIQSYYKKYGLKWAEAFSTRKMQSGSVARFLKEDGPMMMEFLQSKPDFLKLKWMYDVGSRQEYREAARDLRKLDSAEANLWNKKIELSMAKLSLLAAKEGKQIGDDAIQSFTRSANRRLTAIEVQETLYSYTRPLLRTALDRIAETDLAAESFGTSLKSTPVLAASLRQGLENLVKRDALAEDELIDTLTLMTCPSQVLDDEDFAGRRFFLALLIMKDSEGDSAWTLLQRQIIWRRCILEDDWVAINDTQYKVDAMIRQETQGTALFKTLLAGFSSGLFDEVPPLPPSELVNINTTASALRASNRFHGVPDAALEALSADLSAEHKALAKNVEKGRLELWWSGIVEDAKTALRQKRDNEGANLAYREGEKRKIEAKLAGGLPNGLTNGVHHSNSPGSKDGDGDVVME